MRMKRAIAVVTLVWIVGSGGRAQQPSRTPGEAGAVRPYEAVSNTALSITGSLRLSATQLIFARDLRYRTETLSARAAGDAEYANGAGSWSALFNLPAGTRVELRRVIEEEVGSQAPNRGLCGQRATTFIALAAVEDPGIGTTLKLAAFSGATPPGPSMEAASLCGTFIYAPAAVKKRHP